MNSSKEIILARIREGLKRVAPIPGSHDDSHGKTAPSHFKPGLESFRRWLPEVSEDGKNQWALLTKNFTALKTNFALLDSTEKLKEFIQEMSRLENWKRVGIHRGEMTSRIEKELEMKKLWVNDGYSSQELEKCEVGITECDAIVAQTGSILITSKSAGGRGLSALVPHHLVLAKTSQIVPDLPAAYEFLHQRYQGKFPSMMSLITGPSRTGDIERIVVLGAHGPKKLTVLLLQD